MIIGYLHVSLLIESKDHEKKCPSLNPQSDWIGMRNGFGAGMEREDLSLGFHEIQNNRTAAFL